jgi:hypothetical protein
MVGTWKSRTAIAIAATALLVCSGLFIVHLLKPAEPLREGPPITYPATALSPLAKGQFLGGDFRIVRKVEDLPQPVRIVFAEKGGSRVLMADPGKKFLATDLIYDVTLPRKRLIFGGVLDDRCFVHYEQGGLGLTDILAFFTLTSKDSVEPIWQGQCGRATDLQDLRALVMSCGE